MNRAGNYFRFNSKKNYNLVYKSKMKLILPLIALIIQLIISGCVEEFTPARYGTHFLLVVNGLITNQPEVYTVRLSWSIPPGEAISVPLPGCNVKVHDDLGHIYQFTESSTPGTYNSDINTFQGVVGRKYKLHIETNNSTPTHYSYESVWVEMKEVPPIDSLYYEKVLIKEATQEEVKQEGCQIYFNTFDPSGDCRFYRWDYTETWKIEIPYSNVINRICWVTENSQKINIKNTSILSEDKVYRYPILFISNETDRLSIRYSINVNQYSLSENEFEYWEKLQNVTQNTGGLYDIIPSSLTGNLFCVEDPEENVLGYFGVSARTSKRIYIDEVFWGLKNIYYPECLDIERELWTAVSGENEWWWIINYYGLWVTFHKWCGDCTARGTTIKPDFWED